jgi:hypothetical protein
MSRPLEEDVDYHSLNRKASDAFLARLTKYHVEPARGCEPIPPGYDDDDLAPRTMMVKRIQQLVCLEFKITIAEMLAPTRKPAHVLPRHVAYLLAKRWTMLSLPAIGRKFGGRDHSTIYHGIGVIGKRLEVDMELASAVRRLEGQLQ